MKLKDCEKLLNEHRYCPHCKKDILEHGEIKVGFETLERICPCGWEIFLYNDGMVLSERKPL